MQRAFSKGFKGKKMPTGSGLATPVLNDCFKDFDAKILSRLSENSHLIVQGSFEEPANEIKINFNVTIILFLLTLKYNFSSEIQTITNV